jgi:hypothetical protein
MLLQADDLSMIQDAGHTLKTPNRAFSAAGAQPLLLSN